MTEEQRRGITITAAAITTHWRDHEINIIDTPGHVDFTAEVERSLRVLDGAVAVLCGVGGVEAQTETVWRQADKYRVPRLIFVNKLDRMGADFDRVVDEVEERLHARALPLQMPLGRERAFEGLVDLLSERSLRFDPADYGRRVLDGDVPPGRRDEVRERRERLIERIAELDDQILAAYLEDKPLAADPLRAAIRRITLAARAVPVLCGSALHYQGIQPLLDAVCDYLPSPAEVGAVRGRRPKAPDQEIRRRPLPEEPFAALAFKISSDRYDNLTYLRVYSGTARVGERLLNPREGKRERLRRIYRMYANKRDEEVQEIGPGDIVGVIGLEHTITGDTLCDIGRPILLEHLDFPDTVISMAVEPKSQAEKNRLFEVLDRLTREDPTLRWHADPETGQVVLSGMGELHLEVVKNRMLEEFGVAAGVGALRVAYRETIARAVREEAEFVQPGPGHGQYARVTLDLAPDPAAGGKVTFRVEMKGPPLERPFLRGVEQAVHETAQGGVITGYPLANLRVTLAAAEVHPVDSTELAFYTAASNAVRQAVERAGVRLLEPIMSLEVVLPDAYFGEVLKDLQARRADIVEMGQRAGFRVIHARAPLAEMFGYATALRSLTRGRGTHTLEPCDFAEAPREVLERILHGGW